MGFCTAINCIDGRAQIPVIEYLRRRAEVDYVDLITEPGVVATVARGGDTPVFNSIRRRVDTSRTAHGSKTLAVVAHHDCAGNPVSDEIQQRELREAANHLGDLYPDMEILALWVDEDWTVRE